MKQTDTTHSGQVFYGNAVASLLILWEKETIAVLQMP